jgi:hypothetical protein
MLWHKAWLETRWRFLIGLALLAISALGIVLTYPQVVRLLALAPQVDLGGELGRRVAESVALSSTYRGYIWSQFLMESMPRNWTVFAALLGSGGLLVQSAGKGGLFTLSLPASRNRLLLVRAATSLAELFVLAMVPCLLLPLLSPAVGQTYGIGDALIHGLALFIGGSVFFSLAFYCSTLFTELWIPCVVSLCAAVVMAYCSVAIPPVGELIPYQVMGAAGHFFGQGLPWTGLLVSAALSAALLYGASINLARRDF